MNFSELTKNVANELNITNQSDLLMENSYDGNVYTIFCIHEFLNLKGYIELIQNPKNEVYVQFNYYFLNEDFEVTESELKEYKKAKTEFDLHIKDLSEKYNGQLERVQVVDTFDIYDYEDVRLFLNEETMQNTLVLGNIIKDLIVVLDNNWELTK